MSRAPLNAIKAPAYVVIFGSLFGASIGMAKLGSQHGIPPIWLVFWQMLIGGLMMTSTSLARGQVIKLNVVHLKYYFIAGILGNAVPTTLAFMASTKIGSALTGLVFPLSPVLTYAFSMIIRIDQAQKVKILGVALGLIGAALIVIPPAISANGSTNSVDVLWLGIALLIPAFLGLGNIFRSVNWPKGSPSMPLAAGMLIATSVLLLPVMIATDTPIFISFTSEVAIAIFIGNIIMSYVGFIFYFELQRIADPVYFSQISYFITIASMLFGVLVFQESIAWYVFPSIGFIFAGLFLVSKSRK